MRRPSVNPHEALGLPGRRRHRPSLEPLETRTLLSTFLTLSNCRFVVSEAHQ